jgi:hypothetical protein
MRTTAFTFVLTASMAIGVIGAQTPRGTAPCDSLAATVRASKDVSAGERTIWSLATMGAHPLIEIATLTEMSLEREPAAEDRVQFEKRFRGRYGNGEVVVKDLRNWDNFDILALPGNATRMVLTTSGTAQCEARYFFRATTSREAVRVPDPPARTSPDDSNAICENLGGWGYLARIGGADAFLEYHADDQNESFRIVPLTMAGWQPACTVSAQFQRAGNGRGPLQTLNVTGSR